MQFTGYSKPLWHYMHWLQWKFKKIHLFKIRKQNIHDFDVPSYRALFMIKLLLILFYFKKLLKTVYTFEIVINLHKSFFLKLFKLFKHWFLLAGNIDCKKCFITVINFRKLKYKNSFTSSLVLRFNLFKTF